MTQLAKLFAPAAVAVLTLTGCATTDQLSQAAQNSADTGFVAGDGATTSFPISARTQPVVFSGTDEHGNTVASQQLRGHVTVVNFWYAGCAPCRAEAKYLNGAYATFADQDVQFLGVNTRDHSAQAQQFAKEFSVPYPSIVDAPGGRAVQAAFAGQVPLNAVPTTLVLDRQGRVAHRVLGQLAAQSQLETLIKETLAE